MVDETTTEQLAEIEGQGDTVQNGLVRDVTHLLEESGVLDSAKAEQQIEELRSEVSYVQNLLGTERRRVTQLEELVGSLRTINEAQEKAFNAAGKANTDLQHRLNVVAAEWAEQAETIRRLQIELDAAQQVPQAIADRFEEGWNQGTARAVETVLEWLEPIRAVDNEHLANETLQHLPQIMRHLTGLAQD
jgi:chromosome segregation ATPase